MSRHAAHRAHPLILGPSDIARIIQRVGLPSLFASIIDGIREELRSAPLADRLPARAGFITDPAAPALVEWMPYSGEHAVAVKVVAYNPTNRPRLPTVIGTIHLYERETGRLLALMDGVSLTALRTAAASAIATLLLARSNSRVLGLIGAGAQAVAHVHALASILPVDRVLAYDINPSTADSLKARVNLTGVSIEVATLREVERDADVLCTATSVDVGAGPVMEGTDVASHLHINAIGSDFPGKIEVPKALLDRATVFPDFRDQAIHEGECQQLEQADIGPDLATLVYEPGRWDSRRDELTVFDSTGMAVQDYVVARVFARLAAEHGLGTRVAVQHLPADPLNPFDFAQESDAAPRPMALPTLLSR